MSSLNITSSSTTSSSIEAPSGVIPPTHNTCRPVAYRDKRRTSAEGLPTKPDKPGALGGGAVQACFGEGSELGVGSFFLCEGLLEKFGAIGPAEFLRPGD